VDLAGSQQINSVQFNSPSPNTYLLYDGSLSISSFIDQSGSADGTFDCAVTFGSSLTLSGAGTGNVYLQGGLSGSPSISMTGGNYWWAGANGFTPTGLTVSGGYLHLIGTNQVSFGGPVQLQTGGILCVQGFFPSTVSASAWDVLTGGTLKVDGPITGPVNVAGGTFSAGCSPGSAYVEGDLSFGPNGNSEFELATPNVVGGGNDWVSVTGNLTLDGMLNIVALPNFGVGTYRLFDYSGTLVNNGVQIAQAPGAFVCQLDFSTQGQVNLVVTPAPAQGYDVQVSAGLSLIANQLDHGSNTVAEIMSNVPDGCMLSKYDNASGTWSQSTFSAASNAWSLPTVTLNPGEGAFFQSPSNFTLTFTGTPHVPVLPVTIPSGACYLLSRQTNDVGTFTNIVGVPPPDKAQVFQWTGSGYQVFTFSRGGWIPSEPTAAVGEALWIQPAGGSGPPQIDQSYTRTVSNGLTLIANQLDHGSNTLNAILPNVPDGSALYKYDNSSSTGAGWTISSFSAAADKWLDGDAITLNPGEGAFFQSPTNFTLTFRGTPHVPVLPVTIPSGAAYLLSRQTNDVGTFANIVGTPPSDGATVYQWDGSNYVVSIADSSSPTGWDDLSFNPAPEPTAAVGEPLWISPSGGGTPSPAPTFTNFVVVSPSSGTLCAGSSTTIVWTGGLPTWNVEIALIDVTHWITYSIIVPSTPNTGSYPWTVPPTLPPSTYAIYIQEVSAITWIYGGGFVVPGPCPTNNCVPPPSGLGLWLPFDETSGSTSANLFPGGNPGTHMNGPTVIAGYVANSLSFNGANQFVTVRDYPAIDPGAGQDFSIDAWVKRASNAPNSLPSVIVDKRDPNSGLGYSLSLSYGNLVFQMNDGTGYNNFRDSGTIPPDDQWHFIAVTLSRTQTNGGQFYIDGAPTASFNPTANPGSLASSAPFVVAASPIGGNQPWLGAIDEVEFFQRALFPSEVQAIFGAGSAGKCKCLPAPANLGLWLPFDETNGTTSANLAPGGNNGTRINSPGVISGYVSNSLSFNGLNQYVAVPDYPAIDPGAGQDFSLDAWVKRPANGPNSPPSIIVDKRDPNTGVGYSLSLSYGNLVFQMNDGSGYNNYRDTGTIPPDNKWHLIAVTITRSQTTGGRFYIDGSPTGSFDPTAYPASLSNSAPFQVAASLLGGNVPWLGAIDEVEYFQRALAAQEILSLFNAGAHGKCKNGCAAGLMVNCSSNKTVECGSTWRFDPPMASSCCTSNFSGTTTNLAIIVIGTVSNGVCPKVTITRTWLISDACGDSNTCSQTVTVVDTIPPMITCSSNKTVQCGSTWAFDPPTVTDACSGTNYRVTFTTQTNGLCPQVITRTWTVVDACGLANSCSQTVSVVDTTPPMITCSSNKTVQCGSTWAFDPPTVTVACSGTNVQVSFTTDTNGLCPQLITRTWTAIDACGLSSSCSQTVTVVDTTPPALTCSSNKTVVCGSSWSFDPPSVYDNCSGTNVTLTFSTITNGLCPLTITRTWTATDPCGNSNSCSQTVTVASCVPPPSGLVLWLPLDETSGTNTANLYAGGNNGTLLGGPSHNLGSYVDNSLCFSANTGVDQYVNVPDYSAIDPAAGQSFTLDAWVQRAVGAPNTPPCVVLDKRDPNTGNGYSLSVDYGHVILTLSGNSYADSTDVIPADGQWHFVAVTVSFGSTAVSEFYVDGHPPVSFTPASATLATTAPFLVGESILDNHAGNQPWQGCIDEVEMFNRALASNEVAAIFQAGSLGKCKAPEVVCTTNKTVQCGSAWSFDPPVVSSCASVVVTAATPLTNGVCPQFITESWLISNVCWGTVYTCTQEVTVIDTTPPLVHCGSKTIVVPLNRQCLLVIPQLPWPPASDNCTPASQLVYSQSPVAGTIVPSNSCVVTITVTDLCGNSSHCYVTVIGQPKTGPILSGPTTFTVTNCEVPCLLPYVTATDSCCPPSSLHFSQSPPCGTPLGPGITSVTVTVTDCHGLRASKVIHLVITGTESFLPSLYNTAVNNSYALLPLFTVDPHYTLGPVPAGTPTGLGNYNPYQAIVDKYPWSLPPVWPAGVSAWIGPNSSSAVYPAGYYTYTNQFVLPIGGNPASASISGRWAADNGASLYINGVVAPVATIATPYGFSSWSAFTINTGFLPYPQVNTLRFVVTNVSSYTGLRVEYKSALINCYTCSPPAIVSISGNQSRPLNSTAVFHVNVAGTPPLTFQWYHNSLPLSNNAHDSGVNTPTLIVSPVGFGDAGTYYVVISNPCGGLTSIPLRLNVTKGWVWPWAWWNVAQVANPLAATVGPDLVLAGTNTDAQTYAVAGGTTEDFDLPTLGGDVADVMHVAPLPPDTSIQVPLVAPPGSNSVASYSVIMDLDAPSTSNAVSRTVWEHHCCMGDEGQDGVQIVLDAQNSLHLSGSAAGVPFDVPAASPLALDAWNRVALVLDGSDPSLTLYVNGQPVAAYQVTDATGLAIDWSYSPPTLFSSPSGVTGEFYAAGIQFHAAALTSDIIAGIGSPDDGPLPGNDTAIVAQPVLTSAVSNGIVDLSWTGSAYVLQESTDLTSDQWTDSTLPFDQSQAGADIMTVAHAAPAVEGPMKFYRLVFAP